MPARLEKQHLKHCAYKNTLSINSNQSEQLGYPTYTDIKLNAYALGSNTV